MSNNIKLNLKYASEVLGEIEKYPKGSVILAKLQTGPGKTSAIIGAENLLGLMDKSKDETIIYLCNRWALKNQVKISLCEKLDINYKNDEEQVDYDFLNKTKTFGNVTVMSYQEMQNIVYDSDKIKHDNPENWYIKDGIFSLGDYDYIVCDEFHYIVRDAGFNSKTMASYREILRTWYDNSVLLLLTATDYEVRTAIENTVNEWMEITKDEIYKTVYKNRTFKEEYYKYLDGGIDYSYVRVFYYTNKKDIITTIKNSPTEEKWLWFISNIKKGEELLEEFKNQNIDAEMISSEENSELKQYIIENERFECRVLIATSVLDNGVNIKDDAVVNMVIETFDEITFVQELGRKRINKDNAQQINLYIPKRKSGHYTKKIESIHRKMRIIDIYLECQKTGDMSTLKKETDYTQGKLDKAFYRDFDDKLCLNYMYLSRINRDEFYYNECKKAIDEDEWFFIKEQLRWIGLEHTFNKDNLIKNVVDNKEVKTLEGFLDKAFNDNELYTKEGFRKIIDSLIENDSRIKTIMNEIDGKHTREKGQKIYNKLFEKLGFDYLVGTQVKKETINGKRKNISYWVIVKEN